MNKHKDHLWPRACVTCKTRSSKVREELPFFHFWGTSKNFKKCLEMPPGYEKEGKKTIERGWKRVRRRKANILHWQWHIAAFSLKLTHAHTPHAPKSHDFVSLKSLNSEQEALDLQQILQSKLVFNDPQQTSHLCDVWCLQLHQLIQRWESKGLGFCFFSKVSERSVKAEKVFQMRCSTVF